MSEPAAQYDTTPKPLPCPHCGSTDLVEGFWCVDDDDAHALVTTSELGQVPSIECNTCLGSAPVENWNKRHDTDLIIPTDMWRRPPDLPSDGQLIVKTYSIDGKESGPIVSTYRTNPPAQLRPIVRWMPIPETTSCS